VQEFNISSPSKGDGQNEGENAVNTPPLNPLPQGAGKFFRRHNWNILF
jgi:hypothetical protein